MQCLTILSLRKAVIIEETRQKKYDIVKSTGVPRSTLYAKIK